MNIPVEIVAEFGAVILAAVLASQVVLRKRMEKLERTVLTIKILLKDRGLKIQDPGDTDRLFKKD